jgi:hypothetical protein
MAAGNPLPNYYATEPLTAATLTGKRGLFHGDDKSPAQKHLLKWGLATQTAGLVGKYVLADYLLYYPFIDGDSTDLQSTDNTVTLPRYTTGEGVRIMLVCVAPTTGGGTCVINYTDSLGVAQVTPTISLNTTAANIATIATSQQAVASGGLPYAQLASGSTGVRSVDGITMLTPSGGLLSAVLVRPLAESMIYEINTANEVEFVAKQFGCPRIFDGAYLGMYSNCAGSVAAGVLVGWLDFFWN